MGVILDEFNKAVQDASELKEGLEGCRRLIAEMCKDEQEQQCVADKSLPHVPEYEIEEHGGYVDDMRGSGMQQPELKKMRRGVSNFHNNRISDILIQPLESGTPWSMPQLPSRRDTRMEARARWRTNIVQCLWTTYVSLTHVTRFHRY